MRSDSGEPLRVAFFADCFDDINGVALTSRQLQSFAQRWELPFFSLHAGAENRVHQQGSVTVCELKRSRASWAVEADLHFDPLFQRHRARVREALRAFQPDLIHITALGDCSILGAFLAYELHVPLVASWHTNLHEFGACRLGRKLRFLPRAWRNRVTAFVEPQILRGILLFYELGRVLLAPNPELVELLETRTGKPAFLMQRGVDTEVFNPARRRRADNVFTLGYVGRLSAEKNVRFLAELEQALLDAGQRNFRFVIVGNGSELGWLQSHMKQAQFPGVLRGGALADAYANLDLFVFPSRTDTFGNVVLEAFASGVPVLAAAAGGPRYLVRHGETGFLARQPEDFAQHARIIMDNPRLHAHMGRAARQHAEQNMTWDRVFERVYSNYRACFDPAVMSVAYGARAARGVRKGRPGPVSPMASG